MKKSPTYVGLGQEKWFWLSICIYMHTLQWLVKGNSSNAVHLLLKECNKLDMTAAQYF
jgi:hypothetical protein